MWDLFLPIHTNAYLKVENMPAIGFEIKRKCKVCGEVFLAKTLDSQYCSPKCSKVAWKRKKDAKERNEKLDRLAQHIPDIREYVSVKEAVAMFGVERTTLYRLIKNGTVPAINVGKRLNTAWLVVSFLIHRVRFDEKIPLVVMVNGLAQLHGHLGVR